MENDVKKKRTIPSKQGLIRFSEEHLYYEIWMFFEVTKLLSKASPGTPEFNALLESFIIHAVILIEFFYNKSRFPDAAKVFDYIKDRRWWLGSIPPYKNSYLLRSRRNKEMAHLSYDRLKVLLSEKPWNVGAVASEMSDIVDQFLKQADPELLHPDIYKLKSSV